MRFVIFDAGPLVAFLCFRDSHHDWSSRTLPEIQAVGLVAEAVLTETCHLAAKNGIARAAVLQFIVESRFQVFSLGAEIPGLIQLLEKYHDVPMDFADACNVRLAELFANSEICTTDTDFLVYRKNGKESIPLISPFP